MTLNDVFNAGIFNLNNNYKLLLLLYVNVKISIFFDLANDCRTNWSYRDIRSKSKYCKVIGCFAEVLGVFTETLREKPLAVNTKCKST
ncbi:hypothetical protein GCM10023311_14400 [Flaviramulus aquimarinus]|uniref:Uncharacterized protein n=1 Tax=Flaviramulus aquimarinus TaxID=1170456 RepID=A0ABP9F127_9FLAO